MKATNIGIVKAIISKKMSEDYLAEGKINGSKNNATKFLDIVKASPFLQLEFKVFDRLETKTISSDIAATRYIDNNLSLFESYSPSEIDREHGKITQFIDESVVLIEGDQYNFYVAVGNLIYETLNKSNPDVDQIHDSFTTVLNHIKKDKVLKEENTVIIPEGIDGEKLIEVALDKFSKKYDSLTESDIDLIKTVVMSKDDERNLMFEGLKNENITLLEGTKKEGIEDKVHETIDKIKKMENSSVKNIISLHELKKNMV